MKPLQMGSLGQCQRSKFRRTISDYYCCTLTAAFMSIVIVILELYALLYIS